MDKLKELMEKFHAKKDESPRLLTGSWGKDLKVVKDKYNQVHKVIVDADMTEFDDEGDMVFVMANLECEEVKISEEQLCENLEAEIAVDQKTWSFPYWRHNRPKNGQMVLQIRITKGGLAYDGLAMIDYVIYKINLWETKNGIIFTIEGRDEQSEIARLDQLAKEKEEKEAKAIADLRADFSDEKIIIKEEEVA